MSEHYVARHQSEHVLIHSRVEAARQCREEHVDDLVVKVEVTPVVGSTMWLQEPRCHGDKRSADKTGKCVESTRLDGTTRWLYPAVHVSKVSADTGSVETGRHTTVDMALLDSHFI